MRRGILKTPKRICQNVRMDYNVSHRSSVRGGGGVYSFVFASLYVNPPAVIQLKYYNRRKCWRLSMCMMCVRRIEINNLLISLNQF